MKHFFKTVIARIKVKLGWKIEWEGEEQLFEDLQPKDAFSLIQKNKDNSNFVILDVRTRKEYSQGRIGRAINLNYYEPDFSNELLQLDKSKAYIVYCYIGYRSSKAANIMKRAGFNEVYHIYGGTLMWRSDGYDLEPITSNAKT